VETEVETAFEQERQQDRLVLFPIRLDETVMETTKDWAREICRTRHIGDFQEWKDDNSYRQAFTRLLRDLETEPFSGSMERENAQRVPVPFIESQRHIPRRAVLGAIATVVVASSGIAFLRRFQDVLHADQAGKIIEFSLPISNSGPVGITVGSDRNLWFTEQASDKIGRISPGGTITEFPLPTSNSNPVSITTGPDGNLWFTEWYGNKIGRIGSNGTITEFPLPTPNSGLVSITTGPDGNLWFTEILSNKIGRISPGGTIAEFLIPTPGSGPDVMTTGPDGNLWFTENGGNQIGRISPGGTIAEFLLPTSNSNPVGITTGPDGNLWFTEQNGDKIGRITSGK
jgi:streptogramin lyase